MKTSIGDRLQQVVQEAEEGNDVDGHDFYVSASTDDDDDDDDEEVNVTNENRPESLLGITSAEAELQQQQQQQQDELDHPLSSSIGACSNPAQNKPLTTTTSAAETTMMRVHGVPLTPSRSSKTSLLHSSPPYTISPGGTTTHHHHHQQQQQRRRYTDNNDADDNGTTNRIRSNPPQIVPPPLPLQSQPQPIRPRRRQKRRQRQWTVFLFSLTTVLLFADQNLMSPNLTAIANDFDLDDDERDRMLGGDISLAFFLLGAPASFLVGFLADTHDRAVVFAVTVAIGELACLGTYFVQTYHQLYICRAVTGFSVGGALPVIYSILGDLFAAEDRHVVSAVVSAGLGAGISVGQAVAGYLGPIFGWRLPFLVVSIPAMICAALVYYTVQDPERGAMERADH